jgi:hypothetical protein
MSSLVLLGEQPSALELAGVLERVAGGAGLAALAKDGQLATLLDNGVFKPAATVLALGEDDLSAVLALAFAVLAQLTVPAEAQAATTKLAALLTTDPSTRAAFKIRTLSNLINVVGGLSTVGPAQRFAVLLQLLEFALAASGSASSGTTPATLVLQPLSTLASLVDFWKLTPEQSLALYAASYRLASVGAVVRKRDQEAPAVFNLGAQPTVQHEYLFALLKAVDAAAATNPAVLKEKVHQDLAVHAVVASVANGLSATVHTLDPSHLFPLAIVQSLSTSNSANAASAFALLKLVVSGDVAGFAAFEKAHAAFLKEHTKELDSATLLRKLRTLALCQLAVANQVVAAAGDNVLSYSAIRDALKLAPAEDVEGAVIDAVMAGRLDAKMDQEAETLCVKSVARTHANAHARAVTDCRSICSDSDLACCFCVRSLVGA